MEPDLYDDKYEVEDSPSFKQTGQQPQSVECDEFWVKNRSTANAPDGQADSRLFGAALSPSKTSIDLADKRLIDSKSTNAAAAAAGDVKGKAKANVVAKKAAIKEAYDQKMKALGEAMQQQLDNLENDEDEDEDEYKGDEADLPSLPSEVEQSSSTLQGNKKKKR